MKYVLFLLIFFMQKIFNVVGSGGNVFNQTHFNDLEDFLAGGAIRITFMPYLLPYEIKQKKFSINIVGNYSKSTNIDKLAQFFLPYGDLLLTVTGGNDYFVPGPIDSSVLMPNNKVVRDIDAAVLGITDPDFFSIISICPESITKYIGIFGYYAFMFNDDNTPKLSLQCAVPIINFIHKIKGNETIYKKGDLYSESPIKTALDGLSRKELLHQRWNFSDRGMELTIIPRVELDISFNYLPIKNVSVETYIGCLIPLKNKCKNNFSNEENKLIFYPTSNSSKHFGFQYGSTISLFLYDNNERSIKFILGNNLLYFLPSDEIRSFDLNGRSWSRYLNAYQNFGSPMQTLQPLTNFLTYNCRVSPNFSNLATVELDYIKSFYTIAIGYSLFTRQSESVTILDDLSNIVLQGSNPKIDYISPISIVRSVSLRLPNEDVQVKELNSDTDESFFNMNYYYAKISNLDIDIASATHPAIFSGELYLKGSFLSVNNINFLYGLSYRFSHNNTSIEYASGWLGCEITF